MKISELMDGISNHDLVLPEFQREYVWTKEQAKQLLVSLFKDYPVGSLLFWKTNDPPELKNLAATPDKLGTIDVILDGQQRLTTLYMLINGRIPPYYKQEDIHNDPRDLYFHLGECDFQYYQGLRMQGNPLWLKVTDCFDLNQEEDINVFVIAEKQAGKDFKLINKLAQEFSKNLTRLRQIRAKDMPTQTVPPQATIDDSIDIFDRVNSQGTKLTDAELALTHVTGKWPQARREMKKKIDELSHKNFYFDLTFMTRALTGVVTERALFEHIHKVPKEELLAGWERLSNVLDYLTSILPHRFYIHSTEDLNTTNALIPVIVYLARHQARFPDDNNIKQATHWLYAALMWSRYTAQTDQRLEQDVSLVVRNPSPWDALRKQIIDQRGRIEIKPSDLEGRGAQHPLFRMTYIISKAQGAVDWFNGTPLGTNQRGKYSLYRDHIFPTKYLYKNSLDSDNHLHRKIANEIANRAFFTTDVYIDELPENYLPQIEAKFPGALAKQFVPLKPELWQVDRYEDFLTVRRDLIARNINEFMDALISEPAATEELSIEELIKLGESATLEFKSTLQWDVVQGKQATHLRFMVLKTIAAFLNSAGGTLIIGVEDDGNIWGLEKDLKLVPGKNLDGFEQQLMNLISSHIGTAYAGLLKTRFAEIDGNVICAVDVERAPEPAYVEDSKGKTFYVRMGNTTRSLDVHEVHSYIQTNWE